jgi:hypothetical protein
VQQGEGTLQEGLIPSKPVCSWGLGTILAPRYIIIIEAFKAGKTVSRSGI